MRGTIRQKRVHIKSAYPIYGAALVFLLWGLLSPIYSWVYILLALITAAGAYVGLSKLFPGRYEETEEEVFTGDAELDAQLKKGRETIARFREAAKRGSDARLQESLRRVSAAGDAITREVATDKTEKMDVYTFFSYYLPTVERLLGYYEAFLTAGSGENVREGKARIEDSLEMVAGAFEKMLDRLYKNEAMDVKTDIAVMETMLISEGLTKGARNEVQTARKGGTNV